MTKSTTLALTSAIGLLLASSALSQKTPATVDQLSWMTGSYQGSMGGGGTLEENWIEAKGGSIGALARSTNANGTAFVELIVVEEEEDSLVLRIQQWSPGMKPRSEQPNVMDLVAISDSSVTFKSRQADAGIQELGYSKPEPDKFVISIKSARGAFDIPLTKR